MEAPEESWFTTLSLMLSVALAGDAAFLRTTRLESIGELTQGSREKVGLHHAPHLLDLLLALDDACDTIKIFLRDPTSG